MRQTYTTYLYGISLRRVIRVLLPICINSGAKSFSWFPQLRNRVQEISENATTSEAGLAADLDATAPAGGGRGQQPEADKVWPPRNGLAGNLTKMKILDLAQIELTPESLECRRLM